MPETNNKSKTNSEYESKNQSAFFIEWNNLSGVFNIATCSICEINF